MRAADMSGCSSKFLLNPPALPAACCSPWCVDLALQPGWELKSKLLGALLFDSMLTACFQAQVLSQLTCASLLDSACSSVQKMVKATCARGASPGLFKHSILLPPITEQPTERQWGLVTGFRVGKFWVTAIHLFYIVLKECEEALKSPHFQSEVYSLAVEMRKISKTSLLKNDWEWSGTGWMGRVGTWLR